MPIYVQEINTCKEENPDEEEEAERLDEDDIEEMEKEES